MQRVDKAEEQGVITSPADTNEYRVIEMQNGLVAMLISDEKTDSSAASIDYGAGSFFDYFEVDGKREGCSGLAHFHEHMLFLGSKEYPGEDDFNNLLTKYAGQDNAFTAEEHTNFHFQCHNEGFHEVLKVWAAFFKSPLMTESAMYREMNQVHSEYQKDLPQDGWREWTMIKQTGKRGHPFQKFDIGSIETLNQTNIHTYLVDWHNKFFSSKIATMAMYSNETLDTMQMWVEDIFEDISSHNQEYPLVDAHPYSSEELNKRYWVKPLNEENSIDVLWQIPVTYYEYRVPALEWIFSMIDYKGPGGLQDVLIQHNLATSVNADEATTARTFGVILITVKLTDFGLTKIEEVVNYVLQYVRLILKDGLEDDWRFQDYTALDEFTWQYYTRPDGSLYSYVSDIASNMHFKEPQDMLYPQFQCPPSRYVWKKDLIRSVLESCTPESLILLVFTKQHNYTVALTEPYFKITYQVETIPNATVSKWKSTKISDEFELAPKNLWTITNTDLYEDPNTTNHLVVYNDTTTRRNLQEQDPLFRGFFGYNTEKKVPKILVSFVFRENLVRDSVRSFTIAKMFKKIALYKLSLQFSQALEVGYGVGMDLGSSGLSFTFAGYTDHILTFAEQFFQMIFSTEEMDVSDIIFGNEKTTLKTAMLSDCQGPAYGQTRGIFFHTLMEKVYPLKEQAAELASIQLDDMKDFIESLQGNVQVDYYVYGNADVELAALVGKRIDKLVKTSPQTSSVTHRHLPQGLSVIQSRNMNTEDKNSASDLYVQIGPESVLENVVFLDLLVPLLKEKAFDQLRTKETLGYIVSAGGGSYGFVLYARVIVVGPKHGATKFLESIMKFLQTFYDEHLMKMEDGSFEEHRRSCIKGYVREDLSLNQKHDIVWSQIQNTNYDWSRREQLKATAESVTKEQLLQFYQKYFLSNERKLFSVQLFAQNRNQTLPNLPHTIFADESALVGSEVFEHKIDMSNFHG